MVKRFEALDAFRGLCALAVVVFHMRLIDSIAEFEFFRGSDIFVEFFFVLSGFVLAHGYGFKGGLSFRTFMKSRFFRLYPLHFFMLLVFILLEFGKYFAYKIGGFTFNNAPFTNSFGVNEILPNLLLIQSWLPFANPKSFNFPAWSISVEFYMYALLFLSIVIFKGYKVVSWLLISLITFSCIYFESDVLATQVLRGLSCFFGGAFTYLIYKQISHIKPPVMLGSIIEFLLLLSVVVVVQSTFESRFIIAPVLFFFCVLFFAFESGYCSKLLKMKPFQYAGKLSYSIYMTHAAILFCLTSTAIVLQKVTGIEMAPMIDEVRFLTFGGAVANNIVAISILLIVIFTSSLTFKHIELWGAKLNRKHI